LILALRVTVARDLKVRLSESVTCPVGQFARAGGLEAQFRRVAFSTPAMYFH
jgi:hypothetical protein